MSDFWVIFMIRVNQQRILQSKLLNKFYMLSIKAVSHFCGGQCQPEIDQIRDSYCLLELER